jgi:hypothetical protein
MNHDHYQRCHRLSHHCPMSTFSRECRDFQIVQMDGIPQVSDLAAKRPIDQWLCLPVHRYVIPQCLPNGVLRRASPKSTAINMSGHSFWIALHCFLFDYRDRFKKSNGTALPSANGCSAVRSMYLPRALQCLNGFPFSHLSRAG